MAGPSLFTLDDPLVEFLESGIPIQVGTRNAFNKTAYSRSWGCKVNGDRQSIVLFLYRSDCQQALQNIRDTGAYSANFLNVYCYESYQLKGTKARVLNDLAPYRSVLSHYRQCMEKLVDYIGVAPIAVDNMAGRSMDDYVPVHCPVYECYRQTPGPGAGAPVARS